MKQMDYVKLRQGIHGLVGEDPFLLFLSPHQPHFTPFTFAPESYYHRLPKTLTLPGNVPEHKREASLDMYRHYLAMILAVDDMLGNLLDYLDAKGLADNTIVVFASDHGTQGGAQGINPWSKKTPTMPPFIFQALFASRAPRSRQSMRPHHVYGGLVPHHLRVGWYSRATQY